MLQEEVILGARALGDQIVNIMPTYQIMLKQLDEIREAVHQVNVSQRNHVSKVQVYNNTVGIFGPRGAGKTSALYTLRNDLNEKSSVIFPLIEPDNFGENTKIIGSIVGFMKKEGESLLEKLKKERLTEDQKEDLSDYFNAGVYKPNNKLKQVINETIEYHLYTESQYRNILSQHYEDLAAYIKNSSRVLSPDIAFKEKLNEFIEEIIRVKQVLDLPKEPVLIFIFIDDIDLKTSKTRELMEALLKYTDHPNIVTVLSGDYDILLESLTLSLLADEPLREIGLEAYDSLEALDQPYKEIRNDTSKLLTIMERKSELAHEYLKKIIPSARRHQLVKWNTGTIPYFSFGQYYLMDRMAQLMGDRSIFNYIAFNDSTTNKNKQDVYLPIKNSYGVFDERPRGLVYAYYNLVQLLNDIESHSTNLFRAVKAFVDTLILSNTKLLRQQQWLFEQFLQWGGNEQSTYINYSAKHTDEEELDLPIFIVAEIVKKLLPNVRYEETAFQTSKVKLFEKYIRGYNKGNIFSYSYSYSNEYRLYLLMRGLVLHTDVPAAMLMLEKLSESIYDPYYYEYIWDNERRDKDQFVVKCITQILEQYPLIFEPLYYKAQYDKNYEINTALNILHDLCNVPAEVEVTERIFEGILRNSVFSKTTNLVKDKEIKRTLFINNLTRIRNKQPVELTKNKRRDLESNMMILVKDSHHNLANGLVRILKKISEYPAIELPKSVTQTIEEDMEKFSYYLLGKLMERDIKVYIELAGSTQQVLDNFEDGYAGKSKTTRYRECKDIVTMHLKKEKKSILLKFNEYNELLSSLEELASNVYAWYGRIEARNLYNALQYSSIIAERDTNNPEYSRDSFFTGNDILILGLYYQYYTSTREFSEEQNYEHAKASIRRNLDKTFRSVRRQSELELHEFDLLLEEIEE
ncbi:P-loop NTPase fold protein [Paenibacillus sp. GCM10028914]|uniref:P-loop NTPase fold protein n=1 Tax=Paenibacillus sp. GCM10028914 TaxID=3273416 RepID=UPI00361B14A1